MTLLDKAIAVCIVGLLVIGSAGFFQQGQPTKPQVYQVNYVLTNPPVPASNITTSVVGTQGPQTYYYWVVANTPAGNASPAGPIGAYKVNQTLSSSNKVHVTWAPSSNATTYDLLRTTTTANPSGACACAVATAIAGTSQDDISNTLSAYTVNTFVTGTLDVQLTNPAGQLVGQTGPTGAQVPVTFIVTGGNPAGAACSSDQIALGSAGNQLLVCPQSGVGSGTFVPTGSGNLSTGAPVYSFANNLGLGSGAATFISYGAGVTSATETSVRTLCPNTQSISHANFRTSVAPGSGNSLVAQLVLGGSGTPLTCTISGAVATSCADDADTVSCLEGQALDWQLNGSGALTGSANIFISTKNTGQN